MSGRGKKRSSPRKTEADTMSLKMKKMHDEEETKMEMVEDKGGKGNKEEGTRSLLNLFLSTPLDDHLPRGLKNDLQSHEVNNVLCVRTFDSLPMVLRRLSAEGFLSAPVVDEQNRFIGFIDMLQLTKATACLFWGESEKEWVDWWEKEEEFANTLVCDIMDGTGICLNKDFTSFAGLEYIARTAAHRICIVDDEQRVTGIFTSSMVVSWMRQNKVLLEKLRNTLVSDIVEKLTKPLISIEETKTALQAFTVMADNNVSGLAVVNSEGVLTSTISIRDIRGYGSSGEKFWRLYEQIKTFKAMEKSEFKRLAPTTHYSKKKVPKKPIFVTPEDTLETVIDFMNDGNIHRIFVCKNDVSGPTPTALISQTDVCRFLLDYCIEISEHC